MVGIRSFLRDCQARNLLEADAFRLSNLIETDASSHLFWFLLGFKMVLTWGCKLRSHLEKNKGDDHNNAPVGLIRSCL